MYQGFDLNLDARFARCVPAWRYRSHGSHLRDNCNLLKAGAGRCGNHHGARHRNLRGRLEHVPPRIRAASRLRCSAHTLPGNVQFSGNLPFSRDCADGRRWSRSVRTNWSVTNAVNNPILGRNWTGVASKSIGRCVKVRTTASRTCRSSTPPSLEALPDGQYRLRGDFDPFNVFNSNWPYTVNTHVLDGVHQPAAAPDERAAGGALLQDRRFDRLLAAGWALRTSRTRLVRVPEGRRVGE